MQKRVTILNDFKKAFILKYFSIKQYLYEIGFDINAVPPADEEEWVDDESTIPQIKEFPLSLEVMFPNKTQNMENEQQFGTMNMEANAVKSIDSTETTFSHLTSGDAKINQKLIRTTMDNLLRIVDVSETPDTQYASGEYSNLDKR